MWAGVIFSSLCFAEPGLSHTVERQLERLGSDDFDEREAAYRALAADPRAEPIVARYREDADPEIRQRAGKLLAHYTQARAERAIRRGTLLLTSGKADLHPDLMRTFQEHDPKHLLHGAFVLMIADLSTREKAFAGRGQYKPRGFLFRQGGAEGYHQFAVPVPFHFRHIKGGFFRQTRDIVEVVICSGDAFTRDKLHDGIILCDSLDYPDCPKHLHDLIGIVNGPVSTGPCNDSVLICDELQMMGTKDSICIARQAMRFRSWERKREIDRGEPLHLRDVRATLHVVPPGKRSFGLIRFFEVADVGLTLDACKVTKVAGPLAKAGVQPGDVFTHVDGVAVKDAEALRKALRRRYAILGYGAFTLTRDGKPITLVAELGD